MQKTKTDKKSKIFYVKICIHYRHYYLPSEHPSFLLPTWVSILFCVHSLLYLTHIHHEKMAWPHWYCKIEWQAWIYLHFVLFLIVICLKLAYVKIHWKVFRRIFSAFLRKQDNVKAEVSLPLYYMGGKSQEDYRERHKRFPTLGSPQSLRWPLVQANVISFLLISVWLGYSVICWQTSDIPFLFIEF